MIKHLIIGIIITIFLSSCSPTSVQPVIDKPKISKDISYQDLRWFIVRENNIEPQADVFADNKYTLVDEEFFTKNVIQQYNKFLFNNNIMLGMSNKNDCDKYARGFSFFSRIKSVQCSDINYSMPVADYYYYTTLSTGHAINLTVVLDNKTSKMKILFIEPQGPIKINIDTLQPTNHFIEFIGM